MAQTPDTRKAEAERLLKQGIEQFEASQFKAALQPWQQALTIFREINDRKGEGKILGNMGLAYYYLGDYDKAVVHHNQSLAIARAIKNREGEGASLGNLGLAYYSLGDYAKAIEHHKQSLAIARDITNRLGEGQSLGNIGVAYQALGDYAQAINYYEQYLKLAQEIKNPLGRSQALGNLGSAYYALGDYAKAIDYQYQGLVLAHQIPDPLGESQSLGNLGNISYSIGNYAKAIEYHNQSLALSRKIGDRLGEGQSLGNLGIAYDALGDYAKAIEYHQQHLALAREIRDSQGENQALGNLGVAYKALEDFPKAIDYQKQRLALARKIKDSLGEGQSLSNLGFALYKSGNLPEAEKNLYASIDVWESIRKRLGKNDSYKVPIFDEQGGAYRLLQKILVEQNKINEALEISERGRSRAFVEQLTSRLSSDTSQAESTVAKPTISQLQQIAKQQNATLVEYSKINDEFKIQGKQQIKESELYIWVIKPTGEVTFRKVDLKPLQEKQNLSYRDFILATRESMGIDDKSNRIDTRSLDQYNRGIFEQKVFAINEKDQTENLHQLYQLLISPIADLLPTDPNQRVVFIPQNQLFLVPFPVLKDKQGKYLIEKHTILTSPSIQLLSLTRQQREKVKLAGAKDAIVVGNPTMPSIPSKIGEKLQQLGNLPGATIEATNIASKLNTKALTGNEATKAAVLVRFNEAKIIHLATHGLFDEFQGLQSSIVLAPSSTHNGLLTAEQILKYKLNADLVVLSARTC